jgi:methionyl-tRNA synthetase
MPKEKTPYQKIRKVWTINPKERFKEDKKIKDPCSKCRKYESNPYACIDCENEIEQIGNA